MLTGRRGVAGAEGGRGGAALGFDGEDAPVVPGLGEDLLRMRRGTADLMVAVATRNSSQRAVEERLGRLGRRRTSVVLVLDVPLQGKKEGGGSRVARDCGRGRGRGMGGGGRTVSPESKKTAAATSGAPASFSGGLGARFNYGLRGKDVARAGVFIEPKRESICAEISPDLVERS